MTNNNPTSPNWSFACRALTQSPILPPPPSPSPSPHTLPELPTSSPPSPDLPSPPPSPNNPEPRSKRFFLGREGGRGPTHPPLTAFPPYFQSKSWILVRPTQPLWLKAFSRRILLQEGPSCFLRCQLELSSPARDGVQCTSDGWLQVIREPRLRAQKWHRARPATLWPESLPVRSAPAAGSTRFCGPRHRNARAQATKLETAMQAVGESDPAYPGLLEALKNPRERPGDGCAGPHRTEFFLEKARKRGCLITSRAGESQQDRQVVFRGRLCLPSGRSSLDVVTRGELERQSARHPRSCSARRTIYVLRLPQSPLSQTIARER